MAPPISVLSLALVAASANNIALSQTPSAAFTLNGSTVSSGVATLDVARRVLFTTTDNTHSATIVGTGANGLTQTETVAMNGTSIATVHDYKTITAITASATFSAAVTVGTNTTGSTLPLVCDVYPTPGQFGLNWKVTGSATFSIEVSNEDYSPNFDMNANSPTYYDPNGYIAHVLATFAGLNASGGGVLIQPCTLIRLTVTAGTGTVQLSVQQATGFQRY